MANIEKEYLKLLKDIMKNGKDKSDRTGTGTKSVFGRQIRHDMSKGFPLLTTKKTYFKGIVTELLWFLRGDTNIKWLVNHGNNIWVGDAYKNFNSKDWYETGLTDLTKAEFVEKIKLDNTFAERWGELGPVYGKQWRKWDRWKESFDDGYWDGIDQIQNAIDLLKSDPDSRRNMVSTWNVGELDQMVLPPCHYGFQLYTTKIDREEMNILYNERRGLSHLGDTKYDIGTVIAKDPTIPRRKLSLMWNQRSVDTFLGLPFNIASYALLLEIIAKEVNMIPDELIGNLGDVHLYKNHIKQAKEQMTREPRQLPKLVIANNTTWNGNIDDMLGSCIIEDFQVEGYDPHEKIVAPLSN